MPATSQTANLHEEDLQVLNLGIATAVDSTALRFVEGSPGQPVMAGQLRHWHNQLGLSLHRARVREVANGTATAELQAGISFNLVLQGEVHFSLGGRARVLTPGQRPAMRCHAYALAHPELLTRQMRRGTEVNKLNLYATREWLYSRCGGDHQRRQLDALFARHAELLAWDVDSETRRLAREVMNAAEPVAIAEQLAMESLALRLFSRCLETLARQPASAPRHTPASGDREKQLMQRVETAALDGAELPEVAARLGLSVSTLQRRFKAAYGITVAEHLRHRRLQRARNAMALEGASIGEAAYLAGYDHASNFIAAFRRHFGAPPAAYIKAHEP
ncbi:helix-turn-helix transcriptional regulator [Parahaliea mediterranea]|uniref:Helix-turn-helix transcriptional regulator n=1 Tax=Parahaliea mediterranea TaxID=651086 RepID=A0A939DIP0_9GAMM|nr:AraC family transcriptional regulator [Parahaliea mediterranea]MBN7799055.1 helix-turn-helix transcriptional regulator [Parahaliea mediterranea]